LRQKGYQVTCLFSISELVNELHQLGQLNTDMKNRVLEFVKEAQIEKPIPQKKLTAIHPHPVAQRLLDIAHQKKSNLIASVDLTTSTEILSFLKKTGPHICAAKLHVDIIHDFSTGFIQQLRTLADEHQFLIIEDRKFADIGNTQLLQLTQGIYRIADWADIITIHLISGEAALKALQEWSAPKKPALLPVIEMSSTGALTDSSYIERCQEMMKKYPEVIGAVCQQTQLKGDLLKFTPGVNIDSSGDGKGQQYNTPTHVLQQLRSDFLIIGRGLYQSNQPEQEAWRYLEHIRAEDIF
jgi:uridine monophosphate synthetase